MGEGGRGQVKNGGVERERRGSKRRGEKIPGIARNGKKIKGKKNRREKIENIWINK